VAENFKSKYIGENILAGNMGYSEGCFSGEVRKRVGNSVDLRRTVHRVSPKASWYGRHVASVGNGQQLLLFL